MPFLPAPRPVHAVIQVLVIAPPPPDAPSLQADLLGSGMAVCARATCAELVREALRHAPDVIVVWEPHPGEALWAAVRLLEQTQPRPVLVFTADLRAETMDAALAAGIDGWVVNGYAPDRLRPLVQHTQARFRQVRALRDELTELQRRFDERKLVDRAKGILMGTRQVNEDEAHRLLRSASMHAKQRIGQVSQLVIDAAQYAEAINRAGRLRMLSQRIVKLQALMLARTEVAGSRALLAESREQVERNLAALDKSLSRPTFGDLIDAAQASWAAMRQALDQPVPAQGLAQLDQQAEQLLAQAERLTSAVAAAGAGPSLQVINVAGRQRMLSQRLAKQVLIATLLPMNAASPAEPVGAAADAAAADATVQAFEQGLGYLRQAPLSSAAIRTDLAAAEVAWQAMLGGTRQPASADGRLALARSSEELLALFDRLTDTYEHSMQMLIG
ncbi:MAG: type IV pili methyl-accepting chemotaxis transducer N-terminal domain-containing protein [Leptothrix sp. (in: b-proteobacteria)]